MATTWSTCPSGGDFAAASAAMRPEAPERFSTTTVWPRAGRSGSARSRATRSTAPPGEKPTSSRTSRSVKVAARARPGALNAAKPSRPPSAARRPTIVGVKGASIVFSSGWSFRAVGMAGGPRSVRPQVGAADQLAPARAFRDDHVPELLRRAGSGLGPLGGEPRAQLLAPQDARAFGVEALDNRARRAG